MKFLIIFLSMFSLVISVQAAENLDYGKSHRFGVRGGFYYPAVKAKALGFDLETQWNAKIHQNVDSGPKIGLFYRSIKNETEESDYIIVPITFTFRFYPLSRSADSTHGWLAPYAMVNAGYYFSLLLESNKFNASDTIIPEGLGGFGFSGGIGLELGTLGIISIPDFVWFIEAQYRKASMDSRRNYALNLDGFTVSLGFRM